MNEPQAAPGPRWRALERNERRAAGVLAEKAKTTPDAYPLTLNSLVNGCNQKSNRFPQMTLDEDQVSQAIDGLRHAGAVSIVQGDGRAEKYRHLLYDWLGVDKAELAVMAELLLRGAQTVGELRGRAARMEPIPDINALIPIVERLREKGLVIYLSPAGRGAVVTHNLYQPQELAKVRAELGAVAADGPATPTAEHPAATTNVAAARAPTVAAHDRAPATPATSAIATMDNGALDSLRSELAAVRRELAELRESTDSAVNELRRELVDLRSQLGG